MEVSCGLRPILVCADLEGVKEFAEMLLDFYNSRRKEKDRIEKVSSNLLRQVLRNDEYSGKGLE